jgi:hypothetical protein
VPGAVDALNTLGWMFDPADADFLVLPAKKSASMADVSARRAARQLPAQPPYLHAWLYDHLLACMRP